MKNLVALFITIFFSYSLLAQGRLKIEKDMFTGTEIKSTSYQTIGYVGNNGTIKIKLEQYIDKDTTLKLFISIKRATSRCLGQDSRVLIKAGKQIVTIDLIGKEDCGLNIENYGILSKTDIPYLKENKVIAIRVHYTNDFDDFKVSTSGNSMDMFNENNADYFIRAFKLFKY
jgi:hypothetical protein